MSIRRLKEKEQVLAFNGGFQSGFQKSFVGLLYQCIIVTRGVEDRSKDLAGLSGVLPFFDNPSVWQKEESWIQRDNLRNVALRRLLVACPVLKFQEVGCSNLCSRVRCRELGSKQGFWERTNVRGQPFVAFARITEYAWFSLCSCFSREFQGSEEEPRAWKMRREEEECVWRPLQQPSSNAAPPLFCVLECV